MKPLLVFVTVLLSAACAPMTSKDQEENVREITYRCADGETLVVRYAANLETATLIRHGHTIALAAQPSGSGFHYSNGRNTLRGKGEEITLEIGRRVPIRCRAENINDQPGDSNVG